jgi:drug/metabolite transporter (DMT)-like permease
MHGRTYGIILVALSAVLWSTAGLFVRMANLDAWTILGWRSLFSSVTLGAFVCFQNRSHLCPLLGSLRGPGIVSVAISVISSISYIISLRLTTVANVMTIYAALPFIATAIAYFWQGEKVLGIRTTPITWPIGTGRELRGIYHLLEVRHPVGAGLLMVFAAFIPVLIAGIVCAWLFTAK